MFVWQGICLVHQVPFHQPNEQHWWIFNGSRYLPRKLDNYCLSDFSEEKLLVAIAQVKVWQSTDPFYFTVIMKLLDHEFLFPAHVAWICKHPDLERHDLSSVMSISVMGSSVNPIYELQIFDKLPNLFSFHNVTTNQLGLY